MKPGKYDAIVAQALLDRVPVARALRSAGFSEQEVMSCQGMLSRIKARLAPEDEQSWKRRKRHCYLIRRRAALERLESGTSRSEAGDLQLIEAYDRVLTGLGTPVNDADCPYDRRNLPDLAKLAEDYKGNC